MTFALVSPLSCTPSESQGIGKGSLMVSRQVQLRW